ncbi:redox-sensitive transcriptional activator SoxR [Actinospongicola halichondriae]|uniref:redox-sensitive transcriptional activator SoxR n=1 Tax=Actinospongicola halichondriae TaxID=3236844 RepID=UPI003D51A629
MSKMELSIGEVAERSGLAVSAVRYYESEGLIDAVRTSGNQRRFPRDTLRRIGFVRAAQRVGLTLDEAREALERLPTARTPTQGDWARLATAWRPRLDEQIARLEKLRDDLDSCIGCGCLSLDTCALYNPDDVASALGAGARYLQGDRPSDVGVDPD